MRVSGVAKQDGRATETLTRAFRTGARRVADQALSHQEKVLLLGRQRTPHLTLLGTGHTLRQQVLTLASGRVRLVM